MHIPIEQVFDMARAVGFYRDVLGFEVAGPCGVSRPAMLFWPA